MILWSISLTENEFHQCEDFAKNSAKTQREYRSGGTQTRKIWLIEQDTLRGKVGEIIAKNFLEQKPLNVEGIELDFGVYPRGIWDKQDFVLGKIKIAIKSAKWFSRWLLLESKDIARDEVYDYYILVTIDKDCKSGTVKGYASKEEILNDSKTQYLKKGEFIPGTNTVLDADNHARHSNDLHNSEEDWNKLIKTLRF
jgi:hypothetical protein